MGENLEGPKRHRIFILMASLLIVTVIIDNLLSNLAFDVNVNNFPFIIIFTFEVLIFSISSLDESLDHLETLFDTESLNDKPVFEYLSNKMILLRKKLINFLKSVEEHHNTYPINSPR